MHGQGFATLALAEAYGMFGVSDTALREYRVQLSECLKAAIKCIEDAQTQTGGWGYLPRDAFHEGSVTITEIQALRACRNSGFDVNTQVIEAALKYIRDSQWLEGESMAQYGGFRYHLSDNRVTFALTAAAVSTFNAIGKYDTQAINRGIDYMIRNDPFTRGKEERYKFYARFYASQAYYQHRSADLFWRSFYPQLIDLLETTQGEEGEYSSGLYGESYGTAFTALTLAIPFGYLPIFQR